MCFAGWVTYWKVPGRNFHLEAVVLHHNSLQKFSQKSQEVISGGDILVKLASAAILPEKELHQIYLLDTFSVIFRVNLFFHMTNWVAFNRWSLPFLFVN